MEPKQAVLYRYAAYHRDALFFQRRRDPEDFQRRKDPEDAGQITVRNIVTTKEGRTCINSDTHSPLCKVNYSLIRHISSIHSLRFMAESQFSGMESYP